MDSKIDDLLSGKVVNLTENRGAFHPKYRKNKGFINEHIKSDTDFAQNRESLKDENTPYYAPCCRPKKIDSFLYGNILFNKSFL